MVNRRLEAIKSKISDEKDLQKKLLVWRMLGDKIVFTNGCFDILHRGHLEYLAEAAALGNRLVIGLNSDESVQRLKGPGRPVNTIYDRAMALAALGFTDAIIVFSEDTPLQLIKLLRPDVLVKGGDYTSEEIVGALEMEASGGEVAIISFVDGYSTTTFLDRLRRDS